LLHLVLDVFIEFAIPFHWIFEGLREDDTGLYGKVLIFFGRYKLIIPRKIDRHRDSTFFRQVRNFTETLGVLFVSLQGREGQNIILERYTYLLTLPS